MNGQFLASVILILAGLFLLAASAFLLTKGKKQKPGYVLLAMGVLLACASIVLILTLDTGGSGKAKAQPYSRSPGDIERVIVDQADSLHNLGGRKLFHKEIRDANIAGELYKRLTELPLMPTEIIYCPYDNGVTYTFDFLDAAGHHVHTVKMNATGCRQVYIDDGAARWMVDPKADDTSAYVLQVLGLKEDQFTGFSYLPKNR